MRGAVREAESSLARLKKAVYNIRVVLTLGRGASKDRKQFQISGKADWPSGKWHKIDVTWDRRHLAIYVNDKIGQKIELKDVTSPDIPEELFQLIPIFHHGDGRYHNGKDRSFIDEVEIWDSPLSADKTLERYLVDTGGRLIPPLATIPAKTGEIVIDGKLDDEAWTRASRVPIFADTTSGFPHSKWASAMFCHDEKSMYFGLSTPQKATPAANATERDGKVWEGDAFELFILTDMEKKADFFQFIVNSSGVFFDGRGGRGTWDASDITIKTHCHDLPPDNDTTS